MIRDLILNIEGPLNPYSGQLSALNGVARNCLDEVNALAENVVIWDKVAADGAAATATAETPMEICHRDCDIINVDFLPLAALTGDPTNNAVLNVFQRDLNGVNQLTVATVTTTTSMVAFKRYPLTLSANLIVVGGGSLSLSITKGGSGVVVSAGTFIVRTRLR